MQREILDYCERYLKALRSNLLFWCVERPSATIALALTITILLLPLIMASVLMPFAILLDFSHFLATKGLVYIMYIITFQVFSVAVLLVVLFMITFILASSITVIHSYSIFSN